VLRISNLPFAFFVMASLDSSAAAASSDGKGASKGKEVSEQKRVRVVAEGDSELKVMMTTMMNQMAEGFKDVRQAQSVADERFVKFADEMATFKHDTAARWATFDARMTKMDTDYTAKMIALDGKVAQELKTMDERLTGKIKDIEELLAKSSRPAAGCLATAQVDPWASYSPTSSAPGSRTRSSSVPSPSHDEGYDPCKIWVKGYRRPPMRNKLIEQYNEIIKDLPDNLKTTAKHNIRGPSPHFSFSFPDASLAARAYDILRPKDMD
jgi:hypothetical protein